MNNDLNSFIAILSLVYYTNNECNVILLIDSKY